MVVIIFGSEITAEVVMKMNSLVDGLEGVPLKV